MIVCRRSRVVLLVCAGVLGVARVGFAQPQPQQPGPQDAATCANGIPRNVDPGLLAAEIIAVLRRSETFRAQCERVASDRRVHVHLVIATAVAGGGRAQSTLRRYPSGALDAQVELLFGEDYRELLAHEFEHVIEQLDGLNLRQEVGRGTAWQVDGGAFETRRARLAGLQVLREFEAQHAHLNDVQGVR
jgi:hypothetical protein